MDRIALGTLKSVEKRGGKIFDFLGYTSRLGTKGWKRKKT